MTTEEDAVSTAERLVDMYHHEMIRLSDVINEAKKKHDRPREKRLRAQYKEVCGFWSNACQKLAELKGESDVCRV
jgi:hypothetical protein